MALYARQMQFTWDQIHYLEVRPYQNVKWIRQAVFKISRSQAINCYGGHLGFRRMPKINSVRGLSSIKAISKCEVNPTSGFQDIAFTSNCGRTDGQGDSIIRPVFQRAYKNIDDTKPVWRHFFGIHRTAMAYFIKVHINVLYTTNLLSLC